jgi:hypothetical protein
MLCNCRLMHIYMCVCVCVCVYIYIILFIGIKYAVQLSANAYDWLRQRSNRKALSAETFVYMIVAQGWGLGFGVWG